MATLWANIQGSSASNKRLIHVNSHFSVVPSSQTPSYKLQASSYLYIRHHLQWPLLSESFQSPYPGTGSNLSEVSDSIHSYGVQTSYSLSSNGSKGSQSTQLISWILGISSRRSSSMFKLAKSFHYLSITTFLGGRPGIGS